MKDIPNHPLFTDITPEEEVSVQGGNMFFSSSCSPLIAAVKAGRLAVQAAIKNFPNWFAQPDNGLIFWDQKGAPRMMESAQVQASQRIGMYLVAPNSVLSTMENGTLSMFEMLGPLWQIVNYCKDAISVLSTMENGTLSMFEMLGSLRPIVNYCKDAMSQLTSFFLSFILIKVVQVNS
jgi:hypothetical protein